MRVTNEALRLHEASIADPELVAEVQAMDRNRLESFVYTLWTLNQQADEALVLLPECPTHGRCLPYAKAWILRAVEVVPVIDADDVPWDDEARALESHLRDALALDRSSSGE